MKTSLLFKNSGASSGYPLTGHSNLMYMSKDYFGKYGIGDVDSGTTLVDFELSKPDNSDYFGGPFYRVWRGGDWGIFSAEERKVVLPIENIALRDVFSWFWNRRTENRGGLITLTILLIWKLQSQMIGRKQRAKKIRLRVERERAFVNDILGKGS